MKINRRSFIQASTVAGCTALAVTPAFSSDPEPLEPLKILILGGTGFIGPHQVNYALGRGHTVTLFNRGKTNTHLFPDVEKLRGDRNDNLTALEGDREWDVVIDNSATIPRWVRQSAGLLKGRTSQYIYVSSLSVYSDTGKTGIAEDGELYELEDPTVEEITGETYGGMKAYSEAEARKAFPENHTVLRPTLIVGPGDPTDRFTYWPARIYRGGEILAPGTPDDPVQIIDARDLSEWMIRLAENRIFGTFNASSRPMPIAEMLYGIKASTSKHGWFTWVPADFLEKQKVRPWADMPAWIPPIGEYRGFSMFSVEKALGAGLTFRPLAMTSRQTMEWFRTLSAERQKVMKSGLSPERESEVLKSWHRNNV